MKNLHKDLKYSVVQTTCFVHKKTMFFFNASREKNIVFLCTEQVFSCDATNRPLLEYADSQERQRDSMHFA